MAVDGRIVAASQTYPYADEERFYALVPPAAYVDTPHRLQLFRVAADDRLIGVSVSSGG